MTARRILTMGDPRLMRIAEPVRFDTRGLGQLGRLYPTRMRDLTKLMQQQAMRDSREGFQSALFPEPGRSSGDDRSHTAL